MPGIIKIKLIKQHGAFPPGKVLTLGIAVAAPLIREGYAEEVGTKAVLNPKRHKMVVGFKNK